MNTQTGMASVCLRLSAGLGLRVLYRSVRVRLIVRDRRGPGSRSRILTRLLQLVPRIGRSRCRFAVSFAAPGGGSGLSRPRGRPRVHGRHAAISAVAFAEPSGGNNDGDTEYETCGGKAVQDRVSSRAFLGLCHVVRPCWRPPPIANETELAGSEFQRWPFELAG